MANSAVLSPQPHHTHSCSLNGPSWWVPSLPPTCSVHLSSSHCTYLSPGPHCYLCVATLPTWSNPSKAQHAWLPMPPPRFPSSLTLCTTFCPACPELEPLWVGASAGPLAHLAPMTATPFRHVSQLLPAVKSACLLYRNLGAVSSEISLNPESGFITFSMCSFIHPTSIS